MLIKIIKSDKVAIDCRTQISFEKGKIEDIDDNIAKTLIELGIATDKVDNKADNSEEVEKLKALRKEGKELNIKSSHVMGIDKLKEAIKAKKAEKALPPLQNKAITNINNKNN